MDLQVENLNSNNKKDILTIDKINIKKLINELEENAWYGKHSEKYFISGNDIIKIEGYVIEPCYESFSTAHSIKLNGEVLYAEKSRQIEAYYNESYVYGRFDNSTEAIEYIKTYLKNREVIIQDNEPVLELQNNEKKEALEENQFYEEEEEEF